MSVQIPEGNRHPASVFGMLMYNNAQYLRLSLESLSAQSFPYFAVVMLDDASTDDTATIAEEFASRDTRFVYRRNMVRAGITETSRRVYKLARKLYPSMRFFAWATDHDLYKKDWLKKMMVKFKQHNNVSMVYPLTQRIDEKGSLINHNIFKGIFSTVGSKSVEERFRKVTELERNFGNMVYGLYNAKYLQKAGIYRDVLIPDRLLMQELSLFGDIMQVEEVLWYRRFRKKISLSTQSQSIWPSQRPLFSHLPWEVVHTLWLLRAVCVKQKKEISKKQLIQILGNQLYLLGKKRVFKKNFFLKRFFKKTQKI